MLRFYPKINGVDCQVNIRGQQDGVHQLKESVVNFARVMHTIFVSKFAQTCLTSLIVMCHSKMQESVVVKTETSFDHVWLLRDHVDRIAVATGAGIRCPDVSISTELPKKYCVWIRGSLDQAYLASSMLNVSFNY